jgi:aminopeptidase YwaD
MKPFFYLLTALLCINSGLVFGQTDKELAASLITKEKIEAHIYFLASDELKGRATGTNEKEIAAQYLANTLHSYGVKKVPGADGYFQNIPLTKTKAPSNRTIIINGEAADFAPAPLQGDNINYDGPAVFLNYGLEEDYEGQDVKGKLVFVKAGSETVKTPQEMFQLIEKKSELAQKNGAKAVVELAAINPMIWNFIDRAYAEDRIGAKETEGSEDEELHYLWLLDPENKIAGSLATKRSNFAAVNIAGIEEETIYTRNVVAMLEGTDPFERRVYHLLRSL